MGQGGGRVSRRLPGCRRRALTRARHEQPDLTMPGYIFPAAFMAVTFAMTGMMICLGLAGRLDLAADFGIVHGATVALFYAFSANARSVILAPGSRISPDAVLSARFVLMFPLCAVALYLSSRIAQVEALLALVLVVRRCMEWIAEVHLSEMELKRDARGARAFFVLQVALFPVMAGWLLADLPSPRLALLVWATSPVWLSLGYMVERVRIRPVIETAWGRLLPHFGSTAIIGISVYVFRLLILLLVGKAAAGDLYTAFAIGGLLGSVFTQAIGPTLALHESQGARTPAWLGVSLWIGALLGAAVLAAVAGAPGTLAWTGKSAAFWSATGLSLIGGSIMILAQRCRLRMLQHHSDKDVFGPDVLMNILIVAAVPYLYYLVGAHALAPLYLLSAVMALAFYYSADRSEALWGGRMRACAGPVKIAIALLLFFPLFFQLGGTIFRETGHDFDTGGILTRLPVPLSVLACYAGIAILGRYARAHLSLTFIFVTFTLMLTASVLLTHGEATQEQGKLILMIQYVLPMLALVLGQSYESGNDSRYLFCKAFLWVLAVLAPVQLAAGWIQGNDAILTPHLYLFSIHQHLQYVPLMFVAAYVLALHALWDETGYRSLLLVLGPVMGIYVVASLSTMAMIALPAAVIGFAVYARTRRRRAGAALLLATLTLASGAGYFALAHDTAAFADKFGLVSMRVAEDSTATVTAPKSIVSRSNLWRYYVSEVFGSATNAALGHAAPPDRTRYPSAHNYYLDFAYNFGFIAMLPLLGLIGLTLLRVRRRWRDIVASPPLLGLTVVVLFLVLADNSVKVGMRQPYPGILTFFLWGALLTRLGVRSDGGTAQRGTSGVTA